MNRRGFAAIFAALMVVFSAGLFLLQYSLYGRSADTGFYLLQDLAFLPINVLLVTLGVNAFIGSREKQEKIRKLNILVSEFFTETGIDAIRILNAFVVNIDEISACATSDGSCDVKDFKRFLKKLEKMNIVVDAARGDLAALKASLIDSKKNMLSMFENPNVFEHDRFTQMLWALYHLMDELRSRDSLDGLSQPDLKHLSNDIRRAYALLVAEWATIIKYMRERYPYLYSLAERKNPFERHAAASVEND
jgi:hypothetical protein